MHRLCPAIAGWVGCAVVYVSADAQDARTDIPIPIAVHAQSARTLADSLGIVTHLDYLNTPYGDLEQVKSSLAFLGIHHVRDTMPRTNMVPYESLARLNYHFDLVVRSEAANELPVTLGQLEGLERRNPGAIAAIEGLNEANRWPAVYHDLHDFPAAVALQRDLYAAVKRSPTLRHVPVFAPTLGGAGPRDYERFGDLSDYADFANAHIYFPKGSPPSQVWDAALALNRLATPRLPRTVITETGYTTARRSEHGVDEPTQAKYLLTLLAQAWSRGITQLYIYALVDDSVDDTDWTRGLGLYRYDWTAKPAATAVHHLLNALRSGRSSNPTQPAPARTDPALSYSASPASGQVRLLLLRKDDGGLDLLAWRDVPLWDNTSHRPRTYSAIHVSLTVSFRAAAVEIIDPANGARRTLAARNGQVEFDLTDSPLLLELSATTTAAKTSRR